MFEVILPVRTLVGLIWMLHCVLCLVHSNINIFCNFIRYEFLYFYIFRISIESTTVRHILVHFAEFFLPEDEMILTSRKLGANKILSSEVFNKKYQKMEQPRSFDLFYNLLYYMLAPPIL